MIAFVKHGILFCKLLSFWKLTKFFCPCLRDFLACAWCTKETCEVLFCLWCEPNYAFLKQLSMYHLETLESYDNFASLFFKLQWNYSESLCSWKNMLKNKKKQRNSVMCNSIKCSMRWVRKCSYSLSGIGASRGRNWSNVHWLFEKVNLCKRILHLVFFCNEGKSIYCRVCVCVCVWVCVGCILGRGSRIAVATVAWGTQLDANSVAFIYRRARSSGHH